MDSISVIVTAHNCAPWIEKTLASVEEALAFFQHEHGQASDREVIIVDDGSSEDTAAIVQRCGHGKPGWKLVRRTQASNPSCARNTGARQARGTILFFLDGDDLFLPNHLAACSRALQESGGDYVKTAVQLASPVHPDWKERIDNSLIINLAVRKHCHEAIGGFPDFLLFRRLDEQMLSEADVFYKIEDMFYNRLLTQLLRGCKVNTPTVEYCRHPGNGYDRQYERYRYPFGQYADAAPAEERFRLQLGEVVFQHLLPRLESECRKRLGRPPQISAALQAARRQHQAGNGLEAERLGRQAVQAEPGNADAWLVLALAEEGQRPEAIACFEQALRQHPTAAATLHNLGVALAHEGRLNEAVERMEQSVQSKPDYAEAYYSLGCALQQLGRRDEAIARLRQCLQLQPHHAGACNNLGLVLTEARERHEGLILLQHAVRQRPELKEGHNNLGLALTDLGRFAEAEASFEQALRLDSRYVEAHSNLGNAYKEQGRLEEALASYQLALWLAPESVSTRYNRSLAFWNAVANLADVADQVQATIRAASEKGLRQGKAPERCAEAAPRGRPDRMKQDRCQGLSDVSGREISVTGLPSPQSKKLTD